jgi:hypothetical protein
MIILYRGHGVNYKFEFELINKNNFPNGFLLENHVIGISGSENDLNKIYRSFNNQETIKFINLFIKNNSITINDMKNNILLFE